MRLRNYSLKVPDLNQHEGSQWQLQFQFKIIFIIFYFQTLLEFGLLRCHLRNIVFWQVKILKFFSSTDYNTITNTQYNVYVGQKFLYWSYCMNKCFKNTNVWCNIRVNVNNELRTWFENGKQSYSELRRCNLAQYVVGVYICTLKLISNCFASV